MIGLVATITLLNYGVWLELFFYDVIHSIMEFDQYFVRRGKCCLFSVEKTKDGLSPCVQ